MLSATSSSSDSPSASTRAPASAWVLTTSNSAADSRPGLSRIESGMAILPTSCSGAAWRMWVIASSERPSRLEIAPARDGLGRQRRLDVAHAAVERRAVEQRAQAQRGGRLALGRIEGGGCDQRGAGAQLERVEQVAQLGLGGADR